MLQSTAWYLFPNLVQALERAEAGEAGTTELRVLLRHANSDQSEVRVRARTALAKIERDAGNARQAWTWVEEI